MTRQRFQPLPTATTALVLAVGLALAAVPTLAEAEKPYAVADRSWISLTGSVAATTAERFTLDYGEGLIQVEMDDWDWYDEARRVVPGDRVTVYGRVDDSLYEKRTIEADSVYVFDRNTFYYANDADEEGDYQFSFPMVTVPDGSWVSVSGKVQEVAGRELVLDTGLGTMRVDTILMPYNPLDDVGFQKIDEGDRISVTGTLDLDFFEKREIQADSIVSLTRDASKKRQEGSS